MIVPSSASVNTPIAAASNRVRNLRSLAAIASSARLRFEMSTMTPCQ